MRANPLSPLTDALSSELTLAPSLIADAPSAAASPSGDALSDAQYDDLVAFHGIERERLVLIHPGSHKASPAWPAERYADVADQLAADGWQIAIIGDAPDPERTAGVLGTMQTAALFLVGAVAPRTLPRLIADAQLLLSDDAAAPRPSRSRARSGRRMSCCRNIRAIRRARRSRDAPAPSFPTWRTRIRAVRSRCTCRPYTMHSDLPSEATMKFDLQTTPVPDPIADPNRDPEADPLTPPSPGHRPDEPQHPDAPPDKDPIRRF